jgi:cytochrome c biogenesis factor
LIGLPYELTQFIPLILIIILTIVFYIMGHSDKSNRDVVVEFNPERSAEIEVSGAGE